MENRYLAELGVNLQKILDRLLANQNLCKLLYFPDKDPLSQPDIVDTKKNLLDKYVLFVPRLNPAEESHSVISLRVSGGDPDIENTEYTNIGLDIEIFTPLTQWKIKDVNLRPFCIMSEIKKSLQGKSINGLGTIQPPKFRLNFLTDEISSYIQYFYITQNE